jgi:hypothetical protein
MQLKENSAKKIFKFPAKKDWEKLSLQIRVCFPELFDLMNDRKSLSEKEHHLLLLILLGFRGKEIMNIWGLSYQSITNMRAQINEKLFHELSSKTLDENLSPFFIIKK